MEKEIYFGFSKWKWNGVRVLYNIDFGCLLKGYTILKVKWCQSFA